jgi:hypothetical protein
MGPLGVVEGFELTQGVQQVVLVPDQGAVEKFSSAGLDPPLHERVHPRHPDTGEHHFDPRICHRKSAQVVAERSGAGSIPASLGSMTTPVVQAT